MNILLEVLRMEYLQWNVKWICYRKYGGMNTYCDMLGKYVFGSIKDGILAMTVMGIYYRKYEGRNICC